ncbi:MAG: von Willebrand factor type A domain-containing protein [Akkermansiaceae bacterium]
MKNEDQMIDALLKEHACNGNAEDNKFLEALEDRLDNEDRISAAIKPVGKRRGYGVATGIAAALAIGAVGVHHYTKDRGFGNQVAVNESKQAQEQRSLAAPSASPSIENEGALASAPGKSLEENRDIKSDAKLLGEEAYDSAPTTNSDVAKSKHAGDTYSKEYRPLPLVEGNPTDSAPRPESDIVRKPAAPSTAVAKVIGAKKAKASGAPDAAREQARITGMVAPKTKEKSAARPVPILGRAHRPTQSDDFGLEQEHYGRKIAPQEPSSGNRYGSLTDNIFKSPWKDPLSTFSVDVDTASYANVRRLIQAGQAVPRDAVRIEEMINYFSYDYPQPEGKHPFSVNVETASCPWNEKHRLVKVGLKGKDIIREQRPAANLVFLLDVSGSMNNHDKLPLLVDSMKILLKELNADDSVSIVVYAGAQGLALPPTYVNDEGRKTILKSLENMRSGGSTNGGAGITLAYKMAKKHFVKGGINRVILGTDGDFNVGVTGDESLVSMVERKAKSGVFLSVLGFGQGNLNDSMLEKITNKGNGNYSYIDSLREGRKVFLDDMMGNMVTIAKDVKIQIEFNPAKVSSYRLIGYANRMLKKEDFKNKLIDAGEIGAGHTVTALYEIVPGNAAEAAPEVDGLKYQKNKPQPKPADREVVDSPEMMTVKLAYKQPEATKQTESTYFNTAVVDGDKTWQKASDDFKFSSGVALFGMLQRQSEYAGQGDYDLVRKLAEQGRGKDEKGHRTEFSDIVRKVAR